MQIIPAILSQTPEDLLEKCALVDGLVSRIQIDIVGRAFSSELSVGIETLERLQTSACVDVQLMVREPITFLNRCEIYGIDRVFGHVEYMRDQQAFIEYALASGMQVGLAIDLETPVSSIEKTVGDLDAVLLMSVLAGKSGQSFDKRVLQKISELRSLRLDLPICVDGGVTLSVIKPLISAGATEFAVGSFLWESKNIKQTLADFLEAAR